MLEENKEVPVSFYVLALFSILFLVFFFIGQETPQNKEKVTGALTVAGQDLSSPVGLIILGTISILLIGFIVLLIVKMRHKKNVAIVAPVVPKADKELSLPGSNIEAKSSENKLTEREVENLFKEQDSVYSIEEPAPKSLEKPQSAILEKPQQDSRPSENVEPEKVMVNLVQLKYIIVGMLKERKTGQDIIDFLLAQGYAAQQIEKATDDINVDSLRDYIRKCLSQGLSKSQIFESLISKKWRTDLINKAFLSFNQ
ncbi:hypothetical protein HY500_02055 [Candidatus Woesearchaeota archaeon]|nr:hypothetical protein [Candidatus Woesearchaeota archaeon]